MVRAIKNDTAIVASIVREARTSQGLHQSETAERAGVSAQAVMDVEAGRGTLATLLPVLGALDIRLVGLPAGRSLPERLRRARERRGLSLDTLAEKAGLSRGAVTRIEAGVGRVVSLDAVLRIVAPKVRARKPDTMVWEQGGRDSRFTPLDLFKALEHANGAPFDLDPCGHPDSPVWTPRMFTEADDGLAQAWRAQAVFCNPPYSVTIQWIAKAHEEWRAGRARRIMMLLPVRTAGTHFHDLLAPNADLFFLRHKVQFHGSKGVPTFNSMVAIFGGDDGVTERMLEAIPCSHFRFAGSAPSVRQRIRAA